MLYFNRFQFNSLGWVGYKTTLSCILWDPHTYTLRTMHTCSSAYFNTYCDPFIVNCTQLSVQFYFSSSCHFKLYFSSLMSRPYCMLYFISYNTVFMSLHNAVFCVENTLHNNYPKPEVIIRHSGRGAAISPCPFKNRQLLLFSVPYASIF